MILGIFFAIISGLLWGLIFIGPLLIPEYPSVLQASARYIAFGLISLPLSWYDREHLYKLTIQDWFEAIKLVLTGHLIYYTCLTSSIQYIGAPISTAIIGTLPLIIIITTYFIYKNEYNIYIQRLSIHTTCISICFIGVGLLCINISELKSTLFIFNIKEYCIGTGLSVISVLCWTWYALRNTYWLKTHPFKPMTWSNAQGVVVLPLSCCLYCIVCIYSYCIQDEFILPFGPRPKFFIILMIFIGFCCSWLGTFFWNIASQRLPTILIGPLIVCETIFGIIYAFIYRQMWPSPLIWMGIILLIIGIIFITFITNYNK